MKTLGYILFAHVVIALLFTMVTAVPFTNENVKRQRINDALRFTAETTAFLEANDPQLTRQFSDSKEHTHRVVWEYIDAINNRNSTEGLLLLSFICSNLGIAAYLVFKKSEKKK
jgi:hypothetical protein